jgi:hypothetical protein
MQPLITVNWTRQLNPRRQEKSEWQNIEISWIYGTIRAIERSLAIYPLRIH